MLEVRNRPEMRNVRLPTTLTRKTTRAKAAGFDKLNFFCMNPMSRSKRGDIVTATAMRAGRRKFIAIQYPAYTAANFGMAPGASGESPVLLPKVAKAIIAQIPIFRLLTAPYESAALAPREAILAGVTLKLGKRNQRFPLAGFSPKELVSPDASSHEIIDLDFEPERFPSDLGKICEASEIIEDDPNAFT
jgi:hypothetical protein